MRRVIEPFFNHSVWICLRPSTPVLGVKKNNHYLHFTDIGEDEDKRNYSVSYEIINLLGSKTKKNIRRRNLWINQSMSFFLIQAFP